MADLLQTSFTGGELDERLMGREDLQRYYSGCKRLENFLVQPQGGLRRRPGTRYICPFLAARTFVAPGSFGVSSPIGTFDVIAGRLTFATLADLGTGLGGTVLQLDLGSVRQVAHLDLVDVALDAESAHPLWLVVESSVNGAAWTPFGLAAQAFGDSLRTRRFGQAGAVAARYLRARRTDDGDIAALLTIADVRVAVAVAAGDSPAVKTLPFAQATTAAYALIATGGNLLVLGDAGPLALVGIPHTGAQLADMTWVQSLDTLILLHPDVPPWRVMRQGDAQSWDSHPLELRNVPLYNFGDSPGGVDEVQRLRFLDYQTGDTYNLSLNGERTVTLAYAATAAENATALAGALNALGNVGGGVAAVVLAEVIASGDTPKSETYQLTFSGDSGQRNWPEVLPSTLSSSTGAIYGATDVEGEEPGEPLMSASRGWPRCGAIYQGALYLGGFRSLPAHIAKSRTGDVFDFNDRVTRDDAGFVISADGDTVNTILALFAGRHLQVLTQAGEYYFVNEPITPSSVALKQTSQRGAMAGIAPVAVDGATLFLQTGGAALREYVWAEPERSYIAPDLALLAPHMLTGASGLALRRAGTAHDADWVFVPRADGSMAMLATLRDQEITAWSRWSLAQGDKVLAVCVTIDGAVHLATQRLVEGVPALMIERWDESLWLDAAVRVPVSGAPITGVAGLERWNGALVDVIIDGSYEGTVGVVDGVANLPVAAAAWVEIGRLFTVGLETMPVRPQSPQGGTSAHRRKRIVQATLTVRAATGVSVRANGAQHWHEIVPRRFGPTLDLSSQDLAVAGSYKVQALRGHTYAPTLELRQRVPGPCTLDTLVMGVSF